MERSRRVGVKSIYARTDEEEKPQTEGGVEGRGDKTSAVVGTTPHTAAPPPPRTRRGLNTPSPSKRTTTPLIDEVKSIGAKKRPTPQVVAAPTHDSPPAKRGRPRLADRNESKGSPAPSQSGHPPQPSTAPTLTSPSTRGRKAPLPIDQPILDQEDDIEEELIIEQRGIGGTAPQEMEAPPNLEMCGGAPYSGSHRSLLSAALARQRGRPSLEGKKRAEGGRDMELDEELVEEDSTISTGRQQSVPTMGSSAPSFNRYMFNPDILTDFYEHDMIVTELGDKFLKVRDGALQSLLKREVILSLIVNDTERAENNDWVNMHPAALPPLTSNIGTYVCFVETKNIEDAKFLTTDGLSPWSSSHPLPHANLTPTRPKVRKWGVYMRGGEYCISGEDWRNSLYVLVEYSALLPRQPRLRKRVYYLLRDRTLLGLAMSIYDYIEPGPVPTIISHGATRTYARQRLEMVRFTDEEGNRSLMGVPVSADRPRISMSLLDTNELYDDDFDDIEGTDYDPAETFDPETGPFVGDVVQSAWRAPDNFVRVVKGNWTSDKNLLLKYLINDYNAIPPFAINKNKPQLPPLLTTTGCFAAFMSGTQVQNQSSLNTDALSPWTSASCRPKTRKLALEQNETGHYVLSRKDWRSASIVLMETCTTLARCPRLRKRLYYVMRNNLTILGYVLFLYEYTSDGEPPSISNASHAGILTNSNKGQNTRRPIKFYDSDLLSKDLKLEGDTLDDVDVMNIGEEVEVDLEEEEEGGEGDENEAEIEEDENIDAEEEEEWMSFAADDVSGDVFESSIRQTGMGERYIVCKTRRLIGDKNLILKYCINEPQFAYERDILLDVKPFMPPLTNQMGIFVFFTSSEHVDPRQINKDGLSPWSSNDPMEVGKQMRTKVKKYALERKERVVSEPGKEDITKPEFSVIQAGDWRRSEYVLVQLHSVLPRCPRLCKKVFYVLDMKSNTPIGHIMVIYEYTDVGDPPQPAERSARRANRFRRDEIDDATEDDDMERECPFDFGASSTSRDSCVFVPLIDTTFLMDRNRQLHYCVNKAGTLIRNGLVNQSVPLFPPLVPDKGDFVFFVTGEDMDARNLTCDGLAPWSDSRLPQATRPKSRKLPVEKSRDGVYRYVGGTRWEQTAYFLVVYYAVLPRCPRLKKRIIYCCNQQNDIIGNVMIIYSYTEEGTVPQQVAHGNSSTVHQPFYRMPPSLRDEAKRLLLSKRPGEVANTLTERSPSISSRAIYNISKSMRPPRSKQLMYPGQRFKEEYDMWGIDEEGQQVPRYMQPRQRLVSREPLPPLPGTGSPGLGVHKPPPRFSSAADALLKRRKMDASFEDYHYDESGEPYIDVVADTSIEVGHSEEISSSPYTGGAPGKRGRGMLSPVQGRQQPRVEHRRRQRIMDFVQHETGCRGEDEILDYMWRLVVERNERKVLENIRRDFGVEIVTNDFDVNDLEGAEGAAMDVEGGVGDTVEVDGETDHVEVGGETVVEDTVVEDTVVEEAVEDQTIDPTAV